MVIVLNDKWHGDDLRERKSIIERRGIGAANVDHAGLGQGNRIIFSAQLTGGIAANGQPAAGFFRQCFPQPLHCGDGRIAVAMHVTSGQNAACTMGLTGRDQRQSEASCGQESAT